jgi:hypothetical protein
MDLKSGNGLKKTQRKIEGEQGEHRSGSVSFPLALISMARAVEQ